MSDIELTHCFNKHQKDFLLSVVVHKARNLNVLNADTFVSIFFNDEIKNTKTYQNSDCPFFNEYFVFEIRTTLEILLRKNIRFVVTQAACFLKKCTIIGEFNVNLSTIWKQDYHTFIKKWGILEKIGGDNKNSSVGYLQIDLAIVTASEIPAPAVFQCKNDDIVEENLLLPTTSTEVQNVKYLINIFDGNFIVKRDYILQVSYGSFQTRTRQVKYSKYCKWNEQMIFHGKFQSLNQIIVFDLLVQDYYQWRVKCSVELNFSDMCWNIKETLSFPSFGPTHISFYEGVNKNLFYGKILISIDMEDVDEKVSIPLQRKQDIIMPLNESEHWDDEIFKINMIIVNIDAISIPHNQMKIFLSCENINSNDVTLDLKEYEGKTKLKFVSFNSNMRPLMTMSIKLPDNRLKNQSNNLLKMLTREMESNIKNYKLFEARYYDNDDYQMRCLIMLHNDLKSMLEGMKSKIYCKTFKKLTEWDENFLRFLQYLLIDCINRINLILNNNDGIKSLFQEYLIIRDSLVNAINEVHGSPSDVYLNVSKDSKLYAFHRFKMLDYFHSQAFDSKGQFCGKIQSIIVKPSNCTHSCENCGCMFAKLELFMWIGSEKETNEWMPQNAIEMASNKINFTVEKYYKCNVYVHQAKIQPGIDKTGLSDPKLIVFINGIQTSTKVINQSLSVVWNEVLVIENVKIFDIGDDDKYYEHPTITMFLFDEDKRKLDLIGIAYTKAQIKSNADEKIKTIFPQAISERFIDIRKIFHQLINQFPPQLRWISFHRNGFLTAEVLTSVELIPLSAPTITIIEREKNEPLPKEICPNMRKFRIDVTFAGIRNAKKISHFSSGRYKIEISMGELSLSSNFSDKSYKKNSNFLDPYSSGYLLLPEQFQFWPPIIIKHLSCAKKNPTTFGAAMIRRADKFFVEEKPKNLQRFLLNVAPDDENKEDDEKIQINEADPLLHPQSSKENKINLKKALAKYSLPNFFQSKFHQSKSILIENEYSWWTKFYNSNRKEVFRNESLHKLKIYHNELEKQKEFDYFNDWASPIELFQGKQQHDGNEKSLQGEKYATMKCCLKISKCSGKEFFQTEKIDSIKANFRFKRIPNLIVEIPVLIRVYIIQALNLRSRDVYGHSDAFLKIKFDNQIITDRAFYVPNQSNPIFGKRYQVSGIIPRSTQLKIAIYDRDTLIKDDLIGKTVIDVEDRIRTKYLASCGLQREYNSSGYNAWRCSLLPSEILTNVCCENELNLPQYFPDHVQLAGIDFTDESKVTNDGNKKERLALSVLNNFNQIPGIGYNFVPEHVETRSLFRKNRPGIEQGKIMMWIEIFDPKKLVPEPVDITPIPPRNYELRVTIWNTKDVVLDEKNIFGKSMSDIYIKGWLENIDDAQFTDIHYRSLTGEGNFNWRMIFPFKYSIGEDMMIITKKKNPFEKFDTEIKMPAILHLQIWDNDTFSCDDFLGTVNINLSHFPQLASTPEKCIMKKGVDYENLFANDGSIRGWCPVYGKSDEKIVQTGKLDLELEVLTQEKSQASPAGIGREGPNQLPTPNRPDTSFNWFQHPLLSMKHILGPALRKCSIIVCLILILVVILFTVIVSVFKLPQKAIAEKIGKITHDDEFYLES